MRKTSIKIIFILVIALLTAVSHGCSGLSDGGLFTDGYIRTDGDEYQDAISENTDKFIEGHVLQAFGTPLAIVTERTLAEKRTVLKGTDAAVLEHGSSYDVSDFTTGDGKSHDFVYRELGDVSEALSGYRYDESFTLEKIEAGDSDGISGQLLGDKVIDLYYGYGFRVTVNYLDKYTGETIKTSFVSDEIENGSPYDFRSMLPGEISYGGKKYLYSLGGCDNEASLKGTIENDVVIDVLYGYYDSFRIDYLSKYDGSALKEPFVCETMEHLSLYDHRDLLLDKISKDGRTYLYSLGSCEGEDLLSGTISGHTEVVVYYGYYNKVTVMFLDKYEYTDGNVYEIKDSFTNEVEHLGAYDLEYVLSENLTVEKDGIKYIFKDGDEDEGFIALGEIAAGRLSSDRIEEDETVRIVYGYLHSIVINYRDKYTGEIIHREIISYDEKYTDYDKTADRLESIGYNDIAYYYSAHSGDDEAGTLDSDKSIVFNYGYDNSVTVCYREEETGEEIADKASGTQEHFTAYDFTGTTLKIIDGYERLSETTGDEPAGDVLDSDKLVTVWYRKSNASVSAPPETGDRSFVSVLEIVILSASILVILVSAVLLIIKRRNGGSPTGKEK